MAGRVDETATSSVEDSPRPEPPRSPLRRSISLLGLISGDDDKEINPGILVATEGGFLDFEGKVAAVLQKGPCYLFAWAPPRFSYVVRVYLGRDRCYRVICGPNSQPKNFVLETYVWRHAVFGSR